MLKKIAEKVIKLISEKLIIQLEELLNADINGDGKIGNE